MEYQPERKRNRGRLYDSWRRTIISEHGKIGFIWEEGRSRAKNREE